MNCLYFSSGMLSLCDVHLNASGKAAARGRGQSWGDGSGGTSRNKVCSTWKGLEELLLCAIWPWGCVPWL